MAKGQKQQGSSDRHDRHDRLLGTYGWCHGHVPSTDQPDLCEDDVWLTSSSGQAPTHGSWTGSDPEHGNSDRSSQAGNWARNDHQRNVGGLSLIFDGRQGAGPTVIHQYRNVDSPSSYHVASASAPVNVPSWSKMIRVDSTDSMNDLVELDPDESELVPPHEYLAREHGKSVTTSVFEGVGRTLKGRDMSRVRDAVWSKTGFFG